LGQIFFVEAWVIEEMAFDDFTGIKMIGLE